MAKKTERSAKGKPAKPTAKPERAKPPKKGKVADAPINREERRKAAWQKKAERKAFERGISAVITDTATKTSTGLTYAQLENPSLAGRQPRPATGPIFEQILLGVIKEQARQFEEFAKSAVSPPADIEPEVRVTIGPNVFDNITIDDLVEPPNDTAIRKTVADEIQRLLVKTAPLFDAAHDNDMVTIEAAAGKLFRAEPEDSPLRLEVAEVIVADELAEAVADFLEEVYGRVMEFQTIVAAFEPSEELEKSARLGLIDEATVKRIRRAAVEEAVRLDLSQRLAAAFSGEVKIDEAAEVLIAEAAQAAEAQKRERAAAYKRVRAAQTRGRRDDERGGRRFLSTRSQRELVELALRGASDEELAKAAESMATGDPRVLKVIAGLEKLWAVIRTALAASAETPELAIAKNIGAIQVLLTGFARLGALRAQLSSAPAAN